jgi:hypothetical protein
MTRQAVNSLIGSAVAYLRLGTDPRTMQDNLGHHDPRHPVHYMRVSARRFEGLWT